MTIRGENASRSRLRYRPDAELTVELSWCGVTHVGLRREQNQDSFVVTPPVFAVADGMGGHTGGEIASGAVVRRLAELGGDEAVTLTQIAQQLEDAEDDIELETGEVGAGAGTTVTGVIFGEDATAPSWRVFNIGDSRVYQFFHGAISQVTVDHSVVQHLIDTGAISREEAEVHPHANVITRAVGFNEDPVPESFELALIPGQRLLICSDGLTKELTDLGLQHFLGQAATAEEAAHTLVEQALGNAGRDNITAVVIDVHAVGDARAADECGDDRAISTAKNVAGTVADSRADPETDTQGTRESEHGDSQAGAEGASATTDLDPDEVFIGDERVEHKLRGFEVPASAHVSACARQSRH